MRRPEHRIRGWLPAPAWVAGLVIASVQEVSACQCLSRVDGGWEMASTSDTVAVVRLVAAVGEPITPLARDLFEEWIEGEVVESLKGALRPGARVVVRGSLGEGEPVDRAHGFRFGSPACERIDFARAEPWTANPHLLFADADSSLHEKRLVRYRPSQVPDGTTFLERTASCQQPSAEPITGDDDPWYRFVKAAIAAQTQSPPLTETAFFEAMVADPSWLIRFEAYRRHPNIQFRKNGLLDPDTRVRRLVGKHLYGPMFEALEGSAKVFHNAYGRWPGRGDMVPLTEIVRGNHEVRRSNRMIADPWGQPYAIRSCDELRVGNHRCEFVSIGRDHIAGTPDDFSSLEFPDDDAWMD